MSNQMDSNNPAMGTTDEELDEIIDAYMKLSPADQARMRGAKLRRKRPEEPAVGRVLAGSEPGEVYEVVEEEELAPIFIDDLDSEDAKENSYIKGLQSLDYTDEAGPFELACQCKDRGNKSFKSGSAFYANALRFYNEALQHCARIEKRDNNTNKLESTIRSNLAAIYMYRKKYTLVILECEKALELWDGNVKACFRGAKATVHLGRYAAAVRYATRGLKFDPESPSLRKLQMDAETKLATQNRLRAAEEERKRKHIDRIKQAREACKERGIRVGKPVMSHMKRTGDDSDPYIDTVGSMHWPLLIMYPESGHSDYICDCSEVESIRSHLLQIMPTNTSELSQRRLPWDLKGIYTVEDAIVLYRSNWTVPVATDNAWEWWLTQEDEDNHDENASPETFAKLGYKPQDWVGVPLDAPFLLPMVQPDYIVADVPVLFVMSRQSPYYKQLLHKIGSIRTLDMPDLPDYPVEE